MINILPDNYYQLLNDEREGWDRVQNSLNLVESKFKVKPISKSILKDFYIFSSNKNALLLYTWTIQIEQQSFNINLVQYDFNYHKGSRNHLSVRTDRSFYFFGQFPLQVDLGLCFIKPETFRDKINELFIKTEIDFVKYPKFSSKYYVIGDDKQKLETNLSSSFFQFMETMEDIHIECRNNSCVFRYSTNSVHPDDVLKFCSTGFQLQKFLNTK